MINPLYQKAVVRTFNQHLAPLAPGGKLTVENLQSVINENQSQNSTQGLSSDSNLADLIVSVCSFMLNYFETISKLGDNDPTSISTQDIEVFSTKGIDVTA